VSKVREIITDKQLLKLRDAMVHGEYRWLDVDEYKNLQRQILIMMEYFQNQVANNAAQKLYLRNP
jgi:hypothetical protein